VHARGAATLASEVGRRGHQGATIALTASVLTALAAFPAHASFPGRNGPIVYSKHGDLFAASPQGTVRQITHDSQNEAQPAVSPDGRKLIFLYNDEQGELFDQIFTSDMRGRHRRWVTRPYSRRRWTQPTWSPDGRHVAFVEPTYGYQRLWVSDSDGNGARILARCDDCEMSEPDWGVNDTIVFVRRRRLWVANATGDPDPRMLPIRRLEADRDGVHYYNPTWSPSGRTIAFTEGVFNISVDAVNADGRNHRRLITSHDYFYTDPTDYSHPAGSPDGRRIALNRFRSPPPYGRLRHPSGIYTIRPDGTGLRQVTSAVKDVGAQLFWATR
jgi:Tol biopolymer transport system component